MALIVHGDQSCEASVVHILNPQAMFAREVNEQAGVSPLVVCGDGVGEELVVGGVSRFHAEHGTQASDLRESPVRSSHRRRPLLASAARSAGLRSLWASRARSAAAERP